MVIAAPTSKSPPRISTLPSGVVLPIPILLLDASVASTEKTAGLDNLE
tara:strand:- start:796 stop:939 length:144 start_codon:yes stop_codon:yes gene_type:complete